MKKKIISLVVLAAMVAMLVPAGMAFAATPDYDIEGVTGSIDIPAGSYTVIDSDPTTADHVRLNCTGVVNLTIENLNIETRGTALSFTGVDNTLTLVGDSFLTSGRECAGVQVEGKTTLSIGGEGSLTANGGDKGAGIGGSKRDSAGTITITGGKIVATGGSRAAGIGGGEDADGGLVTISGGFVTAFGGGDAAGIGGGKYGSGNTINITGGTVVARGGENGAGIGGGKGGNAGKISVSGYAEVYAAAGVDLAVKQAVSQCCPPPSTTVQDIGYGKDAKLSDGDSLTISDCSAVFTLRDAATNSLTPVITATHVLFSDELIVDGGGFGSAYGYTGIPSAWPAGATAYAYLREFVTVTYNEGIDGQIVGSTGGIITEEVVNGGSPTAVPDPVADEGFLPSGWTLENDSTVYTKAEVEAMTFTKCVTLTAVYEVEIIEEEDDDEDDNDDEIVVENPKTGVDGGNAGAVFFGAEAFILLAVVAIKRKLIMQK